MDLNKLSTADKVIGVSAIVFLIAFFLPWWGLDTEFGSGSNSGADYFLTGWIPLLLVIGIVVVVALQRLSTTRLPDLPLPWSQVVMIAGIVVGALVVLRLIVPSSESALGVEIDLDRMWGMFVATLAAIGVAVGTVLRSREPEEVYSGGGSYPGSPPPPPPPGGQTF
jgi:hypothetical protein